MITNTITSVIVAHALMTYPESPREPLSEVLCLADMVYHESRGEPLTGQYGVALVAKNRVESKRYPDSYCEVVHQPFQFSYLNNGKPEVGLANTSVPDAEAVWWSVRVALDVQNGYISDFTYGSKHYVNKRKLKSLPKWLQRMSETVTIGEHTFLKEG